MQLVFYFSSPSKVTEKAIGENEKNCLYPVFPFPPCLFPQISRLRHRREVEVRPVTAQVPRGRKATQKIANCKKERPRGRHRRRSPGNFISRSLSSHAPALLRLKREHNSRKEASGQPVKNLKRFRLPYFSVYNTHPQLTSKVHEKCLLPYTCTSIILNSTQQGTSIKYTVVRSYITCLLYTSPSPRDLSTSRMPSSA